MNGVVSWYILALQHLFLFIARFLGGVSRGELLQPYLVINVTGLVEPTVGKI